MAARYTLVEALEKIATARTSVTKFASRPVATPTIQRLLVLAQLAPSSFNLQPYKMIVVRSDDARSALASSMLGNNRNKVAQAPFSVVFLAQREPYSLAQSLMKLETAHGKDESYVRSLPAKLNFLLGPGWISHKIRQLTSHLASPLTPSPVIPLGEQWATKNTMFAAQSLLFAATAYGLATAPMEGFDERRICFQLRVPMEKYSIPLVVAVGHSDELQDIEEVLEVEPLQVSKPRYPLSDVCFEDKYGQAFQC